MSVLINNMEMPKKSCSDCIIFYDFCVCLGTGTRAYQNGKELIEPYEERLPNCPLVELPEIIRCKDCANRCTYDCPMFFTEWVEWEEDGYIECDDIDHDNTQDDYFCSCAKRKEI